jgi:hypothetical protein
MAKNYIKGSIRKINVGSEGESKLIVSLLLSELEAIKNEKGYVNVVIQERRESDAFGNTHYAYENDYKPGGESKAGGTNKPASKGSEKAPLKAPRYTEPSNPFE